MNSTLHVLSIGSPAGSNAACDALPERQRSSVTTASSVAALYAISIDAACDVVVLHPSLSPLEMCDAGAFIRRRWSTARILAIVYSAEYLKTGLYDIWTTPDETRRVLVWLLERVAAEDHPAAGAWPQSIKEGGL